MMTLSNLSHPTSSRKRRKRVGRGDGSKRGKTSCRGHKGDKSRSGYKRRAGKEGGQLPLFQKLPRRGFTRSRFMRKFLAINLDRLDRAFEDGEVVNTKTLEERGFSIGRGGYKILARGELKKKLKIEAHAYTKNAVQILKKQEIAFTRI